ncbi:MAG: hypothetical protein ACRDRL_21325 [Sciscionella sp.]
MNTDDEQRMSEAADARLLAEVARMLEHSDPVPAALYRSGSFGLRSAERFDGAVEMVFESDSVLDGATAGTRGCGTRQLRFRLGGSTLDVQFGQLRLRRATMLGVIAPMFDGLGVMLDTPRQSVFLHPDAHGQFDAPDVPAGALRLRICGAASASLVTPWFVH